MATEVKDMAYYQDHHDELGNLSDAELDALAEGDTGTPEVENAPELEAPAAVVPEAKAEEAKPEGVATKDGKHVIPFEVLERERTRAADLERIANEQAAQIAALKSAAADPNKPLNPEGQAAPLLSEAQLTELETDLPGVAEILRAQQAQLRVFGEAVEKLNAERQARENDSARTASNTVQAAIDANPKLTLLQAQSGPAWDRAVQFDALLRSDPEWAEKSFDDRFAKVIELYEATHGAVVLPGEGPKEPSQAELAKQAEEKLKAVKPKPPASIGDIPGGTIPATDEVVAALTSKSGAELTADFMRMTPAQIEATLARL